MLRIFYIIKKWDKTHLITYSGFDKYTTISFGMQAQALVHIINCTLGIDKKTFYLIGQIAAGEPIPVLTPIPSMLLIRQRLEVTEDLTLGREVVYALKVKGWSIYSEPDNVKIQGRVIAVIRQLV